jgi:hypothetical protein
LNLFRSFNFLAAVIFLFAFLTSVAFTAMPPRHDRHEAMQTTTRFHTELTQGRPTQP